MNFAPSFMFWPLTNFYEFGRVANANKNKEFVEPGHDAAPLPSGIIDCLNRAFGMVPIILIVLGSDYIYPLKE